jgi:hypothetical protein
MTVGQLKTRYRETFGEDSRSNHQQFLFRRMAWRIQANAEDGLSERAHRRALEIADDADLRIAAPRNFFKESLDETRTMESRISPSSDPRLAPPGQLLVRRFQGKDVIVRVRVEGLECDGRLYSSLNSIVRFVTGTRWNSFAFFGLGEKPGRIRGHYKQRNAENRPVRHLHTKINGGGGWSRTSIPSTTNAIRARRTSAVRRGKAGLCCRLSTTMAGTRLRCSSSAVRSAIPVAYFLSGIIGFLFVSPREGAPVQNLFDSSRSASW